MKNNKAKEVSDLLREHTKTLALYPIPTIEKFCDDNDLTTNEFMQLCEDSEELQRSYLLFKQKQKQRVFTLLTYEGSDITVDKDGVRLVAISLGIL